MYNFQLFQVCAVPGLLIIQIIGKNIYLSDKLKKKTKVFESISFMNTVCTIGFSLKICI